MDAARRLPALGLGSALVALTALVGVPLAALALTALELGRGALDGGAMLIGAIWNTVWTASLATLLSVTAGTALALLTERSSAPARGARRLAMVVALVVPGYIAALAWLRAYAPGGLLDSLLGISAGALVGPAGIVAVLAVEAAPICYFVVAAGLASRAEPDAERAARVSGGGPLTALRTVTLPLLRPSLLAAAAICFVLNATAFGTPAVLGIPAGFATMTTQIYRDLAFSSDPASFGRAIGLALVLALLAAALLAAAEWLLRDRSARGGAPTGPTGAPRRRPTRAARVASATAWLLVLPAVGVPLLALLLTALTRATGLPPTPANLTLDNFSQVLDRHALAAFGNSLVLSVAAAIGVLLLSGLALAARRISSAAVGISFALPGSTLAVAMLLAYGPFLRDTLAIILLCYVAKFWLLGWRPLAAAFDGIGADVARAARVSGATALTAARTITLPLLRPAVVAAALIVFLFGMHEVTMSSLLYGPGTQTLAVAVLNLQQAGDPTLTAALAVVVSAVAIVVGLPLFARLRGGAGIGWRQ